MQLKKTNVMKVGQPLKLIRWNAPLEIGLFICYNHVGVATVSLSLNYST